MITKPVGLAPEGAMTIGSIVSSDENLFVKSTERKKAYINHMGEIVYDNKAPYTYVSDYIEVTGDLTYSFSPVVNCSNCAWYDNNKNFISFFIVDTHTPLSKAPSNSKYLRITYSTYAEKNIEVKEFIRYADDFNLSCQILSDSDIETFTDAYGVKRAKSTLIVWDKDRYYYFQFGEGTDNETYSPIVNNGEYAIQLIFKFPASAEIKGYYYLNKTKMDVYWSGIIKPGKRVSWRVRLYDKNTSAPYNRIGYGSVSEITECKDTKDGEDTLTGYVFKAFPHLNVYDNVIGESNIGLAPKYTRDTVLNILRCRDENIKYWVDIAGYILPVEKYRFYEYTGRTWSDSSSVWKENDNLNWNTDFDGYGNPLSGYFVFDKNNPDTNTNDWTNLTNIKNAFNGESYNVRTNYIDSDWSYFTPYDIPDIVIKDEDNNVIPNGEIIDLEYSSIDLSLSISQQQGIDIDYYSYKIYSKPKNDEHKEWTLDYSSANIYDRRMKVYYDRFFNDKIYRVYICIMDAEHRTWERNVYYTTSFNTIQSNLNVDLQYYHPHNSVILDWSVLNSIHPATDMENFDFVSADVDEDGDAVIDETEGAEHNALIIPKGSSLSYTKNDFDVPLNFDNGTLTVEFYGTSLTRGTIIKYGCNNGFAAEVNCEFDRIQIKTTKKRYVYPLYGAYTTQDIADILSEESFPKGKQKAPMIWDNSLTWDNSYHWYIHNNIMTKWELTISENNVTLTRNGAECERRVYNDDLLPKPQNPYSYLDLYGDVIYDSISVKAENTDLLKCNFADTVNGFDIELSLKNFRGWRVYKTMGDTDKLYEVANMMYDTTEEAFNASRILEDFIIGDNVKITYYIYPVVSDNNNHLVISNPIVSDSIFLQEGVDKVCGLTPIGDRVYEVNSNEVWRMFINLDDNGYTFNTDKNFYDTLNRYNQETTGNRKYITKSVGSMLGYIDCSTVSEDGITDTYDMLVSWNDFSGKPGLKCFVDARGLVLPGNFEANPTVEYDNVKGAYATAKFNWRQMADLDIIKIYGRLLPFNPTRGVFFKSSDGYYLHASNDEIKSILYTSSNTD